MAWNRKKFNPDRDVVEWAGPSVRYDIVKEVAICFVVVLLITVGLAIAFSSPDDPAITLQSWSKAAPLDFARTATSELDRTSPTATYGPPYTSTPGAAQQLGPLSLEWLIGVHIPIDTTSEFVIGPLLTLPDRPQLDRAIASFQSAPASEQGRWSAAYSTALGKASFGGSLKVPAGRYGPVGTIISNLLAMARSGSLDGALTASPRLYGTDYTKALLFVADGNYMGDVAQDRHLTGGQWGMMNETGNYPGQAWLWLYTLWYQVPPMSTSANGDVEVWAIMMVLTLLLAFVPFIPGLRSIPRRSRVYRLVWRRHYAGTQS